MTNINNISKAAILNIKRFMMKRIILLASLILTLTACSGTDFKQQKEMDTEIDVAASILADTAHSGVTEAQKLLIRDLTTWEAVWAEHTSTQTPTPATPTIDFTKQMVVANFYGPGSNGCAYRKSDIARIYSENNQTVIAMYSQPPEPTERMCTFEIVNPALILVVPKNDSVKYITIEK